MFWVVVRWSKSEKPVLKSMTSWFLDMAQSTKVVSVSLSVKNHTSDCLEK